MVRIAVPRPRRCSRPQESIPLVPSMRAELSYEVVADWLVHPGQQLIGLPEAYPPDFGKFFAVADEHLGPMYGPRSYVDHGAAGPRVDSASDDLVRTDEAPGFFFDLADGSVGRGLARFDLPSDECPRGLAVIAPTDQDAKIRSDDRGDDWLRLRLVGWLGHTPFPGVERAKLGAQAVEIPAEMTAGRANGRLHAPGVRPSLERGERHANRPRGGPGRHVRLAHLIRMPHLLQTLQTCHLIVQRLQRLQRSSNLIELSLFCSLSSQPI